MRIEGFFGSIKKANEVVDILKKAGYGQAYVDVRDPQLGSTNGDVNAVGSENAPSLSALVLESGDLLSREGKRPLTAASPMASGMGKFEEIADFNYRIVVDTDEKKSEPAKKIISDAGGRLENPDAITSETLENLDIYNLPDRDINGRII